jgi:hypothetical protein
MIFVGFLFISISVHPKFAQALSIISSYTQKNVDSQCELCDTCYFPKCVALQGNHHVRKSNIKINEL